MGFIFNPHRILKTVYIFLHSICIFLSFIYTCIVTICRFSSCTRASRYSCRLFIFKFGAPRPSVCDQDCRARRGRFSVVAQQAFQQGVFVAVFDFAFDHDLASGVWGRAQCSPSPRLRPTPSQARCALAARPSAVKSLTFSCNGLVEYSQTAVLSPDGEAAIAPLSTILKPCRRQRRAI